MPVMDYEYTQSLLNQIYLILQEHRQEKIVDIHHPTFKIDIRLKGNYPSLSL